MRVFSENLAYRNKPTEVKKTLMKRRHRKIKLAQILRRRATFAEELMWQSLRARRLSGLKFKRQFPIGPYVVDFHCAEHQIAVELDGGSHIYRSRYEKKREAFLVERGIQILHFRNYDVIAAKQWVLNRIAATCGVAEFEPGT